MQKKWEKKRGLVQEEAEEALRGLEPPCGMWAPLSLCKSEST